MKKDDEKSIETKELMIKGNIMLWHGTMIQLSNISSITTDPLALLKFPWGSLVVMLIGLLMEKVNILLTVLLVIAGIIWIAMWYEKNQERKMSTVLSITMNSGQSLFFLCKDYGFLERVLHVLELVIIDGGTGSEQIIINMNNSRIDGNAKILENAKIG